MTTPPAIRDLISRLDATPEHTVESLTQALHAGITLNDVAPWIRFEVSNYARNLIADGGRWELRVLCWRPGQSTSLHGHGGAIGCIRVLRGSAQEIVVGQRDRKWAPGSTIVEVGETHVHQMSNPGPDPLVTLHAYSPPLPVNAPSSPLGDSVVIVGGGFAGIATAIHLLRTGSSQLRITVIERGPWLGRGVAYSQEDRVFRLNVPASRMSVDPDNPGDFVSWSGAEATPHAFLSRADYGRYVEERFAEAVRRSPAKLRIVRGDVASIEPGSVRLVDGRHIDGKAVVLATGIEPRVSPGWLAEDPRIVDGWDECALPTLPTEGRILVLGAGLSAIDIVTLLHHRGFAGHVTILSRRGLLPRPHLETALPVQPLPRHVAETAPTTLRPLLRWVRGIVDERIAGGGPWQEGLDSIRPHLPMLWRRLPPADRARFVERVRPYWEVVRHRVPVDALAQVDSWRARGRLDVRSGSVVSCQAEPSGIQLVVRERGGAERSEHFDAVVRCIGPALEQRELKEPLVRSLVEQGLAQPDPAGLGIVTDERGLVVDAQGRAQEWLVALGALRRASAWETTSVPDIARQARETAGLLLRK